MTKNYPYAYKNLKKDFEEVIKVFDQVSDHKHQAILSNLKTRLSAISLPDDIEIHSTYNNFRLTRDILDQELPPLSKYIREIDNTTKISIELTPILIIEKLLCRLQVEINMFIRSISLQSPDIIEPEEINLPDFLGKTLLMYATFDSKTETINKLLEKGADPFLEDKHKNSAFSIAITQEDTDLVKQFLKAKLGSLELGELERKISEDTKGIFHFIAANITAEDFTLATKLGLDPEGAIICFDEAKEAYERSNGTSDDLL